MKWMILIGMMTLIFGCKPSIYLQKSEVQLSKPIIKVDEIFFEGSTSISISPTEQKAKIVYYDGQSQKQKYNGPFEVDETTQIAAMAIGGGYRSSDTAKIEVVKLPKNEIISISSNRPLNGKYGTAGLDILINRKKGSEDFNVGWLGYLGDTIVLDLEFDVIDMRHLIISTLRNQGAWIFSPRQINIYFDGNEVSHVLSEEVLKIAEKSNVYTKIDVPHNSIRKLRIEIIAYDKIPFWHDGDGHKPWIFIDEVLIY